MSAAGKRAGIKDGTRSGLWAVFAEAIDALRPRYVVIENVRGLLSAAAHRTVEDNAGDYLEPDPSAMGDGAGRPVLRAAGAVLGDLADLGYDAVWATVAAADVGAPHRRERVFILASHADPDEGGWGGRREASWGDVGRHDEIDGGRGGVPAAGRGGPATDTSRYGWDEGRPESTRIVGGFDAAVSGDEPGVALLPTPSTHDRTGARSPDSIARMDKPFANLNDTVVNELRAERGPKPVQIVGGEDDGAVPVLPADGGGDDTLPVALNGDGVAVDVGGCVDGHNACVPVELAGTKPEPGVALLPTPCAQQSGNSPEEHLRKKPGRKVVTDLAILVENGLMQSGGALLPTPNASDASGGGQHPDKREGHSRQLIDYVLAPSQWGKYEPAIRRWEQVTGQPAPPPTEPNKNGKPRLSAAFSEWLMGWPAGWVTDPAIGISRNDQLRIVGNGVCVQQAAAALTFLLGVATGTHTHSGSVLT